MKVRMTKYLRMKNHRVFVDGALVYAAEEESVGKFLRSVYQRFHIDYPKFFKMDNLSKLGFLSAELLLRDTDILQKYPGERLGIVLSNAASSLDSDERHQELIRDRKEYFPSPSVFVYTLANIMAGEIAIRNKIRGENTVFISEGFDPDFTYHYLGELFGNQRVSGCISGWVDCHEERYESFLFFAESEEKLQGSPGFERGAVLSSENMGRLYKGEPPPWKS